MKSISDQVDKIDEVRVKLDFLSVYIGSCGENGKLSYAEASGAFLIMERMSKQLRSVTSFLYDFECCRDDK